MTRSQVQRIVAATLIALIGLVGTSALGFWQYSRAHRDDIARQVLAAPTASVQSLVQPLTYVPEQAFAHRASATGSLRWEETFLTCGRAQTNGASGCWLIAPLFLDGGSMAQTIALGFVPDAERTQALADARTRGAEQTTVTGRLQPGEVIDAGRALLRASDSITNINVNELATRWRTPLLDGYIVADPSRAGDGITTALVLPPSGVTLRNLFYAWQWWTFAAFVLFLLFRYIIDVRSEPRTMGAASSEGH